MVTIYVEFFNHSSKQFNSANRFPQNKIVAFKGKEKIGKLEKTN
jgi:hypothetical protein